MLVICVIILVLLLTSVVKRPVQLFDFRDAENADGILEPSYKNGTYSLAQNVTESVKVWMN